MHIESSNYGSNMSSSPKWPKKELYKVISFEIKKKKKQQQQQQNIKIII
jgi:hypothetical protein